jgi:hypothetical protein
VHLGGYESYAAARREAAAPPARRRQSRRAGSPRPGKSGRGPAALSDTEARIASLENDLALISQQLEHAGTDVETVTRLGQEYAKLEAELHSALKAWEELAQDSDEA